MKTFTDSVTGKTMSVHPVEEFKFRSSRQKQLADQISAKYILVTGDNRGILPVWVQRLLKENNLWFKKIGTTTYVSNTFAIYEHKW